MGRARARQQAQQASEAMRLFAEGVAHHDEADYQTAAACLQEALPNITKHTMLYHAHGYLGACLQAENKLDAALENYKKQLRFAHRNKALRRDTLAKLGKIYVQLRDIRKARQSFKRGLQYSRQLRDAEAVAEFLKQIAALNAIQPSLSQTIRSSAKRLQRLGKSAFKTRSGLRGSFSDDDDDDDDVNDSDDESEFEGRECLDLLSLQDEAEELQDEAEDLNIGEDCKEREKTAEESNDLIVFESPSRDGDLLSFQPQTNSQHENSRTSSSSSWGSFLSNSSLLGSLFSRTVAEPSSSLSSRNSLSLERHPTNGRHAIATASAPPDFPPEGELADAFGGGMPMTASSAPPSAPSSVPPISFSAPPARSRRRQAERPSVGQSRGRSASNSATRGAKSSLSRIASPPGSAVLRSRATACQDRSTQSNPPPSKHKKAKGKKGSARSVVQSAGPARNVSRVALNTLKGARRGPSASSPSPQLTRKLESESKKKKPSSKLLAQPAPALFDTDAFDLIPADSGVAARASAYRPQGETAPATMDPIVPMAVSSDYFSSSTSRQQSLAEASATDTWADNVADDSADDFEDSGVSSSDGAEKLDTFLESLGLLDLLPHLIDLGVDSTGILLDLDEGDLRELAEELVEEGGKALKYKAKSMPNKILKYRSKDNDTEPLIQLEEPVTAKDDYLATAASSGLVHISSVELAKHDIVGSGAYGRVYQGKWGNIDVAVKEIYECARGDDLQEEVLREAKLLCTLKHRNIIELFGVCLEKDCPSLVMEWANAGTLGGLLKNFELDSEVVLDYALQVGRAVEYLHNVPPSGIVHRDLKSHNILLCADGSAERHVLKLSDFGAAKDTTTTQNLSGVAGTVAWTAPECWQFEQYSKFSDSYSFAVVLWELLTGQAPYAGCEQGAVIYGVVTGQLKLPIPNPCPANVKRILQLCWSRNPHERPNMTEVCRLLEENPDEVRSLNKKTLAELRERWRGNIKLEVAEQMSAVSQQIQNPVQSEDLYEQRMREVEAMRAELEAELEALRQERERLAASK